MADTLKVKVFVADDNCAVKVDGDEVQVVGTGEWHEISPKAD